MPKILVVSFDVSLVQPGAGLAVLETLAGIRQPCGHCPGCRAMGFTREGDAARPDIVAPQFGERPIVV